MTKKDFNYEASEKEALEKLRQDALLRGDDCILTPLIKRFLEASMEGELDAQYPIIWMDAIHFKVKEENRIKTKAV